MVRVGFMVNFLKSLLNDADYLSTTFGREPTGSFWYTLMRACFSLGRL